MNIDERHAQFRACLQAAREAIDAVERAEQAYNREMRVHYMAKAYRQQQQEAKRGMLRAKVIDESAEVIEHLTDALNCWWPIERAVWSGRG